MNQGILSAGGEIAPLVVALAVLAADALLAGLPGLRQFLDAPLALCRLSD